MTEAEKRALALQIMKAEQARLHSHSPLDAAHADLSASLRHSAKVKDALSSLAQNGITWDQLRQTYHEAFKAGHQAMLTYKLSFFYAGAAIAFHEKYDSEPKSTSDFINQMCDIAEEYTDRAAIIQQCLAETSIDTSVFDETSHQSPSRALMTSAVATRKDREAVERMKRSGITQKDLEYEKNLGYHNGWNTGAGLSVCYGCAALALHRFHGCEKDEIEQFLERIEQLQDEEISTQDIIARALEETDVDVSEIASGGPMP